MDLAEAREVLGVDDGADWPEVRAAYLRLVRERHPDAAQDPADVGLRTLQTAQVTRAYAVLFDARQVGDDTASARPPAAPRVTPTVEWPDSQSVLLDAEFADAFQAMFEVGHLVGTVSYVDRSSGVLEVIVTARPGEATSLLVYLEEREDHTEAVLGVEPLGRHAPASLDALVDRIATLLASPRPPAGPTFH